MAVTQNSYVGNGSTTTYSFTFPYLKKSEIKASLDATVTTAFTTPTATTVQFNTAPANGAKIKIYRETDTSSLAATFYAGSAIKSEDLNDNFTQNLYTTQEVSARYLSNLGGNMVGDLTLGEDVVIKFEGATDNANETTLTVVDPTADRTITLPNVTGTVVTTGDTETVSRTMIAVNAINGTRIDNDSVDSEHIVADSLDTEHYAPGSVDTTALAADAVTSAKISDNAINSEHYVDGSIDREHLAADIVDGTKIANDVINSEHYAADSIDSEHYAPGSVDATALASNSVTQVKLADDAVGANELATNAVVTDSIVDNAVTLAKMADNSVGSAELINDSVTNAKIANDQIDSEHYVDGSIDTAHIGDDQITNAKIATDAVNADSIEANAVGASELANNAVDTAAIADNAVTSAKIAANAVTTTEIADAELTTLAGMQSGTASKLASSTALTADIADLNQVDGLTKQTTISDSDASFPTSGAVVDYVTNQISGLGGLTVIANDASFPNTQPDSGLVISIADAGGLVINGSGTSTTARTVGGSTVTINNINSQFNSSTLAAGIAMMVTSTGSGQIYNYHKATLKESDIVNLSTDINDFSNRYRVANSAPTSNNDAGDLYFNTTSNKLFTYNGTDSAWEEAQSIGNFYINTISSYSGTGGNSATFNGSAYRFVLSNAPANAQQLLVSINGVIQKPNSGTSQPSEGFVIDGSSIIFSNAPATGSDYFIITIGSSVNTGTPSDNTVSTATLQNLAVSTDKIAANAVTAAKIADGTITSTQLAANTIGTGRIAADAVTGALIADDAVGAEHIEVLDAALQFGDAVKAQFGNTNDLEIHHTGGVNKIISNAGGMHIREISNSDIHIHAGSNDANSNNRFVARAAGQAELYHNGNLKFETTSAGNNFTGKLSCLDGSGSAGSWISMGDSDDFQIFHNTHNHIRNNVANQNIYIEGVDNEAGTPFIYLNPRRNQTGLSVKANQGVDLYYDDSPKLGTTAAGIACTGKYTSNQSSGSAGLSFADGVRLDLGSGDDLRIYHDSGNTKNRLDNYGVDFHVVNKNTDGAVYEDMLIAKANGRIEQYYDGTMKTWTTSWGLQIGGHCIPHGGNTHDLGASNERWRYIYSENALNTSDRNLKNTIKVSDLGLSFVNKLNPVSYKFNDKGDRTHYGLIAQELEETIKTEGKTLDDFAGIVQSKGVYNLAYSELISPLIKAVQELSAEVETLKTKVTALEAK